MGALLLAISGARRVVMIHRQRGSDGAPCAPAPLVEWLARGGARVEAWVSAPQLGRPANAREALVQRLLLRPQDAVERAPVAARKAAVEMRREGFFFDAFRRTSTTVGALEANPKMLAVLTAETGGGERPLSITRLETFASCAFRGYAEQVLGARAKRVAAEIPDALEEGTIVHEALAAAFTRTRESWRRRPRDRELVLREGLDAASTVLTAAGDPTGLRRIAQQRALAAVAAVLERALADEGWDFALAEQPFGENAPGAWPALRTSVARTRFKRPLADSVTFRFSCPPTLSLRARRALWASKSVLSTFRSRRATSSIIDRAARSRRR
jgi:hypothetical protein